MTSSPSRFAWAFSRTPKGCSASGCRNASRKSIWARQRCSFTRRTHGTWPTWWSSLVASGGRLTPCSRRRQTAGKELSGAVRDGLSTWQDNHGELVGPPLRVLEGALYRILQQAVFMARAGNWRPKTSPRSPSRLTTRQASSMDPRESTLTEPMRRDAASADDSSADSDPASSKRDDVSTIQAPLAPPQAHTAPEVTFAPPTAADLYKERLRGIWEATHGGLNPPGPTARTPTPGISSRMLLSMAETWH